MAIYHFSVKVISRANGSSALAAAAYRSASRLHDQRLDRDHDFTRKTGVVHSEVMLPEGAPEAWSDRERLWNAVEAAETRKDAQLAREVEFALPRELDQAQGVELARDFVRREMVDRGMVADLNVHWDIGADGLAKPHAHVMLAMREVDGNGFGKKVRDWNRTEQVAHWREAWADHLNARLAELDIDVHVDHRSLEQQGLDLEPQNKIGPAAARRAEDALEAERLEDHAEIARRNGARIIADPNAALDAITHGQATFTRRDLAMFVHRHSYGKDQFDQAMSAVTTSPDCLALGTDGRGEQRFTSREMITVEQRLRRATDLMAERKALDHDGVRAFAERRGIGLRERVVEVARKVRDIFADFRPRSPAPTPEPQVPSFQADREALRRRAIQRHAGAVADIFRMHDQDLPALPHQSRALHKARAELNAFGAQASRDLERSYVAEPGLAQEVSGGRLQRAIRTLQLEAEIRADPALRADRFVQDWRRLEDRRMEAYRTGDMAAMGRIREHMGAMARSLERDPQMESLLRARRHDLGVELEMGRGLSHDLAASIGLGLGRGRGLEL